MTFAEDFAGKCVIVTGAASGLGRATALAFAAAGAKVAAVDVNAAGLEETAALAAESGHAITSLSADLTDASTCRNVVDQAAAALGGIDALCNVAGILVIDHATDITAETWDRVFAINVRAPFLLIQAALPHLLARSGAVVNVASSTAFIGSAYMSAYSASKAALVQLTKSLALEYTSSPIRINAIAPGSLNTPMVVFTPKATFDLSLMARYAGTRPASEVSELTDLILYLASPRASAVHGACFNIDGGATAG